MKSFIYSLQLLILVLFFSSCEKSSEESTSSNYNYIGNGEINGITFTDVNGNYISTIDHSDWKTMDLFSSSISALFSFNDTINYNSADTSSITVFPAYPNPTNQLLSLVLNSTQATVMKFVIVDSAQVVRFYGAKALIPGNNALYFDFQDSTLALNSKYRMFYRFYHSPNNFYKSGHGDILKQ
ncbi:MAG: hypothetical protein ACKVQV_01175 [Bacteroidia bacterium]